MTKSFRHVVLLHAFTCVILLLYFCYTSPPRFIPLGNETLNTTSISVKVVKVKPASVTLDNVRLVRLVRVTFVTLPQVFVSLVSLPPNFHLTKMTKPH